MFSLIQSHPHEVRLVIFALSFGLLAFFEACFPRRQLTVDKTKRWLNNIALTLLNTLLLKVVFPIGAVGFALLCQDWQVGLLNQISSPFVLNCIVTVILLDGVIWLQHRLFHLLPFFWRFHKVHHADLNLDLSSALRFHAIEILFSMLVKCTAIGLLGAPALAVLVFEILLNSLAMFNHSNLALPKSFDFALRKFIVTPDMHRIHHSVLYKENNSNFGFCLSFWDKVFGTYYHKPKHGQKGMQLGLPALLDESETVPLWSLLILPFSKNQK